MSLYIIVQDTNMARCEGDEMRTARDNAASWYNMRRGHEKSRKLWFYSFQVGVHEGWRSEHVY